MGYYPKRYTKEEFNNFLVDNNVNDDIIHKFGEIPEKIIKNNVEYVLYINVIWYSIGNTFYNFELNYYSEDKIEFLFEMKLLCNVEISINNLISKLENT